MYERILVPLDGSKLAECVLPHAEAFAKTCQSGTVTFIRVVPPLRLREGFEERILVEERQRLEADSIEVAKKLAEIKKLSLEEVINQTTSNAQKVFNLI